MFFSLLLILAVSLFLSFFEDRLRTRDKVVIYCILGIAMILIAGLRSVDSTPDSADYEMKYLHSGSGSDIDEADEPTFRFFADILSSMGLGVNALFLVYALIAIPLHMLAFWKFTKTPFLALSIYLSFFYMNHELVQIRVGAGLGFFLWAVYFHTHKKEVLALILVLIGASFHYSIAAGLLIFALSNKPMRKWEKILYCSVVPLGLIAYFANIDVSRFIPENLGGAKLALYREMKEQGIEDKLVGYPLKFNIVIWLNVIMYYFSIFYEKLYREYMPQITIFIKIQAIGFACLFFINGVSTVLAERLNGMFSIVNIFAWTSLIYSFKPLYAGKMVSSIITTFRFIVSFFFFALSWYFMH